MTEGNDQITIVFLRDWRMKGDRLDLLGRIDQFAKSANPLVTLG